MAGYAGVSDFSVGDAGFAAVESVADFEIGGGGVAERHEGDFVVIVAVNSDRLVWPDGGFGDRFRSRFYFDGEDRG